MLSEYTYTNVRVFVGLFSAMARALKKVKATKKSKKSHSVPMIQRKKSHKGTKMNKWNEDRMKCAISEFKTGGLGLRQIARAWNVPKSTLQRRLKGVVLGYEHSSGRKPFFTEDDENDLAKMLKLMSSRGFPMTGTQIRKLAFEYAERKGVNKFSSDKGSAGYFWLKSFLQRHHLSFRKPEALSIGRASGMNETVVNKWFDDYEQLLDELQIRDMPSQLWNCDETGLQEHFIQGKVVAETGEPCYQITKGEKGQTTTVLACFNGVGIFCPPTVIFKGKRLNSSWVVGSPQNTVVRMSENGWITKEIFFEWAKSFVSFIPKTNNMPHILLLDGHSSHIYNLDFLDLMKANNVHPFIFPAHTTHWLQPADKAFFRSLKQCWTNEGLKTVSAAAGVTSGKAGFFGLFTPAWNKACAVETAQAGFRGTGLFPVNRCAIPQSAYEPSRTSERELETTSAAEQVGLKVAFLLQVSSTYVLNVFISD